MSKTKTPLYLYAGLLSVAIIVLGVSWFLFSDVFTARDSLEMKRWSESDLANSGDSSDSGHTDREGVDKNTLRMLDVDDDLLREGDLKEGISATGDQSFGLSGRVIMKNGSPIPPDLKISISQKRPPFSLVPLSELDRLKSKSIINQTEFASMVHFPVAVPDALGIFLLEGLPENECYLLPRHPCLRVVKNRSYHPYPLAEIKRNEADQKVVIVLEQGGVVEGRVLTPEGHPAESASITLKETFNPFFIFSSNEGMCTPFTTIPSREGHFRFEQVPAGRRLILETTMDGYAPASKEDIIARAGQTTCVDISLAPPATICGVVKDDSGEVKAGIHVKLMFSNIQFNNPGDLTLKKTETDAQGTFVFTDLPAGKYQAAIRESGYIRNVVRGIEVAPGQTVRGIELVLNMGLQISGRVTDATGVPIPDVRIKVTKKFELSKLMETITEQMDPVTEKSDDSGAFHISGLKPGTYELECKADAYSTTTCKDIMAGTDNLNIVLEEGAVFSGIVISGKDGEAVKAYSIEEKHTSAGELSMLDPYGFKNRSSHRIRDDKGKFALKGLAPGTYKFTFKAEGFGSREIVDLVLDHGKSARGTIVVLPGEASITGCVQDAVTGEPIEGARISRKGGIEGLIEGMIANDVVLSDSSGVFRVGELPAGPVRLVVAHQRYEDASIRDITLMESEALEDVLVVMSPGSTIMGHVKTASGAPVFGANIFVSNLTGTKIKSASTDEDGYYEFCGLSRGSYSVTRIPDSMSFDGEGFMGSWINDMQVQSVKLERDQVLECNFVLGAGEVGGNRLTGVIREHGRPVDDAIVSLLRTDKPEKALKPKTTTSGDQGRYLFENVMPGPYTLRIVKATGITIGAACEIVFRIDVPDRPEYEYDLDLPGGAISGLVRDSRKLTPLKAVRIIVQKNDQSREQDPLSTAMGNRVGEVYSDGEGRFRISNLRKGTYNLRAGGANLFGMNSGGYAAVRVKNIEIVGDELRDGVVIDLEKGGTLEGRITDPSGYPLSGASLYVQSPGDDDFETYSECITDGSGSYKYQGLKAGKCAVIVKHPDYALKTNYNVMIEKEETRSLNFTLDTGCAVYVQVHGEDPEKLIENVSFEFTDPSGRNLYGMTSLTDVMDTFFSQGKDPEKGVFVGRFSAGVYYLNLSHPKHGKKTTTVEINPKEEVRVLKANF